MPIFLASIQHSYRITTEMYVIGHAFLVGMYFVRERSEIGRTVELQTCR